MPDFPQAGQEFNLSTICTASIESCGVPASANQTSWGAAAAAWPNANRAIFTPFVVEARCTAYQLFVGVGAASGNLDLGIYDREKHLLVSTGSTAVAGVNAIQTINTTDLLLHPGLYYMAMVCDNVVATFNSGAPLASVAGAWGCLQQAAAHPLPNPAVWAGMAAAYVPLMGLSTRTLV